MHDGTEISIGLEEATICQQYTTYMRGYGPLLDWVDEHMADLHNPPSPHEQLITVGSTFATDLVCARLPYTCYHTLVAMHVRARHVCARTLGTSAQLCIVFTNV
eukprot:323943-Pyramimonas_sp.AAC.1